MCLYHPISYERVIQEAIVVTCLSISSSIIENLSINALISLIVPSLVYLKLLFNLLNYCSNSVFEIQLFSRF